MDGRVEADGSRHSRDQVRRTSTIAAVLILAVAAALLILGQRPFVERERALEQAVVVSEDFIAALDEGDYEMVASLVNESAEISISPARSPQDLEMSMVWMKAVGWRITADRCTASDRGTEEGTQRVLCRLTQESAWSRALGLAPDTRSAFTLEVTSDRIVKALLSFALMSFPNEGRDTFEDWLTENHPEDAGSMYALPYLPSLSSESIDLWRRHTDEFVVEKSR